MYSVQLLTLSGRLPFFVRDEIITTYLLFSNKRKKKCANILFCNLSTTLINTYSSGVNKKVHNNNYYYNSINLNLILLIYLYFVEIVIIIILLFNIKIEIFFSF